MFSGGTSHHSGATIYLLNTTIATTINKTASYGEQQIPAAPLISTWFRQTVFLAYIVTFCVGGIGNFLVFYVLVTRKQRRRSIHLLTLNLAISDLIVTVIYLPTQMYLLKTDFTWGLGEVTCRVVYGVNSCTVNASIGTLLVITYDRYVAVTKPMLAHQRNTRGTKIMICIVWVASMVITLPLLLVTQVHRGYCSENWSSLDIQTGYWIAVFVLQLALPMIFISIAYGIIIYSVKVSQTQFELVKLHKNLKRTGKKKTSTDSYNNVPDKSPDSRKESTSSQKNTSKFRRQAVSRRRKNRSQLKRKRQKNKLLKMSIVLVITYGVCVSPQHAVFFAQTYGSFALKPYAAFVFILSNLLMSMNSAINPCVYGTLNDEMKKSILKVLTLKNPRVRLSRNVGSFFDSLRLSIQKRFKWQEVINDQDNVLMMVDRPFQTPQPVQC